MGGEGLHMVVLSAMGRPAIERSPVIAVRKLLWMKHPSGSGKSSVLGARADYGQDEQVW
jgi:hypothetical protein